MSQNDNMRLDRMNCGRSDVIVMVNDKSLLDSTNRQVGDMPYWAYGLFSSTIFSLLLEDGGKPSKLDIGSVPVKSTSVQRGVHSAEVLLYFADRPDKVRRWISTAASRTAPPPGCSGSTED